MKFKNNFLTFIKKIQLLKTFYFRKKKNGEVKYHSFHNTYQVWYCGCDLVQTEVKQRKWSHSVVSNSFCNCMDCSLQGSSIHEIFQARILEWVAISISRGSSQPRCRTWVSCTGGRRFTVWATGEKQRWKWLQKSYLKFVTRVRTILYLNRFKSLLFSLFLLYGVESVLTGNLCLLCLSSCLYSESKK